MQKKTPFSEEKYERNSSLYLENRVFFSLKTPIFTLNLDLWPMKSL
jgi:hypothetical protein